MKLTKHNSHLTFLVIMNLLSFFMILFVPAYASLQVVQVGDIASTHGELNNTKALSDIAIADINGYMEENGYLYRFKAVVESADGQASVHLEKVKEFHQNGVDLIIGGRWSSHAKGSLSYVNKKDVLLLSPSSTLTSLSIANDNLFRLCPDDAKQAPIIADMLWSWGIEAVIVIQRGDNWGDGIYDILEKEYPKLGGVIAEHIRYKTDKTDFSSYFQKAEEIAVDLVEQYGIDHVGIEIISFTESVKMVQQAKDYPTIYSLKWFGSEGTALNQQLLWEASEESNHLGILSTSTGSTESSKYKDLEDRYRDTVGLSLGFYGACTYDAYWIYALSVIEAGSVEPMDVKAVLPGVASSYEGASGLCTLNKAGDRLASDYEIWGYGYVEGEPSFVKYGHYERESGELRWQIDLREDNMLSCLASPTTITLGQSLEVSGSINPILSNVALTLTYYGPYGSISETTVETDVDGYYLHTSSPDQPGRWGVQAWWEGDEDYKNATSLLVYFTVERIPTTITVKVSEFEITTGGSITVSGTIEPMVPEERLTIHFTKPDGSFIVKSTTTDVDGSYSFSYDPSEAGSWSIKSLWEGDLLHGGATSQTVSFTVIEVSGNLKIYVRDLGGSIIEGASISSTTTPSGQTTLSGYIYDDSPVSFNDVKTGSYTFEASKTGYIAKSGTVNAEAWETNELTITLDEEPSEGKGIPGFPYESILLGLLVGMIMLWIFSRS